MKFAIFRCCPTSQLLHYYEISTNAVLSKLGVTLIDVKEFNCCGYPLRGTDKLAYVLAAVRNLALASAKGLDLITLCNCCYESLKQAKSIMESDASMHDRVSEVLSKEGLVYPKEIQIRHVFEVLLEDIGIDGLKERLVARYDGLKIATHYGCHLLRPSRIVQFDDPAAPTRFDDLVELTGAQSVAWKSKLECCGAPAWGGHDALSINLTKQKIADAKAGGADFLCVACVYCQLQFDRVQHRHMAPSSNGNSLAPILYTQLLGLALGIESGTLGLDQHCMDTSGLTAFLAESTQ
jgi:heterodisulfide reductase subunit B